MHFIHCFPNPICVIWQQMHNASTKWPCNNEHRANPFNVTNIKCVCHHTGTEAPHFLLRGASFKFSVVIHRPPRTTLAQYRIDSLSLRGATLRCHVARVLQRWKMLADRACILYYYYHYFISVLLVFQCNDPALIVCRGAPQLHALCALCASATLKWLEILFRQTAAAREITRQATWMTYKKKRRKKEKNVWQRQVDDTATYI